MTITTGELLTVPEVMAQLKLGRSAVYELIRTHRLASITIGRARRIPADAVRVFVSNEMNGAS
ncbi:helix-turn-helix domain-containing protein [Streptomyces chumphonensis]|uniref:helix-turn-helix domain-containing protein n=1 Tax=Streptomyces chumphonensis TaxID=1214925 RepID=UPI003D72F57E